MKNHFELYPLGTLFEGDGSSYCPLYCQDYTRSAGIYRSRTDCVLHFGEDMLREHQENKYVLIKKLLKVI
jgi:hypothetical protein